MYFQVFFIYERLLTMRTLKRFLSGMSSEMIAQARAARHQFVAQFTLEHFLARFMFPQVFLKGQQVYVHFRTLETLKLAISVVDQLVGSAHVFGAKRFRTIRMRTGERFNVHLKVVDFLVLHQVTEQREPFTALVAVEAVDSIVHHVQMQIVRLLVGQTFTAFRTLKFSVIAYRWYPVVGPFDVHAFPAVQIESAIAVLTVVPVLFSVYSGHVFL